MSPRVVDQGRISHLPGIAHGNDRGTWQRACVHETGCHFESVERAGTPLSTRMQKINIICPWCLHKTLKLGVT